MGPRASRVQSQMWDLMVIEQSSVAIAPPFMRVVRMGLAGPHDLGTEFSWQVSESQRVWLAHARARDGLIKAHAGSGGTMAWVL